MPRLYRAGDDAGLEKAYRGAVAEGLARGEVGAMDEVERGVALELGARLGVVKAADGDSCFVAYWLPEEVAAGLCVDGGLEAGALHLTLLYLGPCEDLDVELVAAVCKVYAATSGWKLEGRVTGHGRFVGDDETDCVVALVDVPQLESLRRELLERLSYAGALSGDAWDAISTHGYLPHITLGYFLRTQPSPPALTEPVPFCVDAVSVGAGAQHATFPFNRGLVDGAAVANDAPYYASRTAAALDRFRKAGRVLSGKHLQLMRDAHEAIGNVIDAEESRTVQGKDASAEKALEGASTDDLDLEYTVTKASEEQRYTLGPLYAPERKDAHGEWTDGDTLQKAVWDYVRESADAGRRLNLQHGDLGDVTCGEWVEVMAWPYEHTITVTKAGEDPREVVMPAGTVYMGVLWDKDTWPLVKSGKLSGLSLGGRAVRVVGGDSDMEVMGDKLAKAAKLHAYEADETTDGEDLCLTCGLTEDEGNHAE